MKKTDKTTTSGPNLSADFPPHSYEDWRKAAEALLKGTPFEKALITKTYEEIDWQPIYRREDTAALPQTQSLPGSGSYVRGRKAAGSIASTWSISQELPLGTPEAFNAAARHDLSHGQAELNILLDLATRSGQDPDTAAPGLVGACGLSLAHLGDLDRALQGVDLGSTSLYFRTGSSGLPVAALLFALARLRGVSEANLKGCIEMDPLASLAVKGKISVSLECAFREMAQLTTYAANHAPSLQTIGIQGHPYHDGGATAVQELAYVLATAMEYFRQMDKRKVTLDTVAPRTRVALSVGSNYFMEIAKIRATRWLWSRMIEALGGNETSRAVYIHGRTSLWNKSTLDPHTNMLRSTAEAFAAVVGGCDSLHVGTYDEVVRVPDELSRRVARNTQVILAEECGLTRVTDPAGGSYFVECLTNEIAAKAWELFQNIEADGGMLKALKAGKIQTDVAIMATAKNINIAKRKDSLVGVNVYPNGNEKSLDTRPVDYTALHKIRAHQIEDFRIRGGTSHHADVMGHLSALLESSNEQVLPKAIEAVMAGASLGEVGRIVRSNDPEKTAITPIPQTRLARPYERLRQAVWEWKARTGTAPKILQANFGPSRNYRVRADWTTAFFQTGGFDVLADKDFKDTDAIVTATQSTGANIVVITSNDENYVAAVPEITKALKATNPNIYILVAGAPGDQETAWREAGVDDFVNVRVGNYNLNEKLLTRLGVLAGADEKANTPTTTI